MITRFESIKNHRVFQDFRWTSALNNFSRFNLIYGGNGTGKTTLSNLFRVMEKGWKILEGEFNLIIDGRRLCSRNLTSEILPPIRVFNEGFIKDNVFTLNGSVSPIFVIGEKSIEAQKQVEALKEQLRDKLEEQNKIKTAVEIRESSLDDFCKEMGKSLKQLLSSSGQNPYNSYSKRNYSKKAEEMRTKRTYTSYLLSDTEKEKLKMVIAGTPKDRIGLVNAILPDLNFLSEQTSKILEKTVLTQSIYELKSDPVLAVWVREGMEQHNSKHSSTCLFCGQPMPPDRIERLEAHFNRQYTAFIMEIDNLIKLIQNHIDELDIVNPPDKAALNDHLVDTYLEAAKELESEMAREKAVLRELLSDLSEKKGRIFERFQPCSVVYSCNSNPITKINEVIQQHNRETGDFQSVVTEARRKLEEAIVAESIESYVTRKCNLSSTQVELRECESAIRELKSRINRIEIDLVSHRRPAEELNQDLRHFLGHDTFKFAAEASGYKIMRKDEVATELSHGERAAISFLYFLRTLDGKGFDRSRGIVVIDDPVIGLDSNALFYAFSYLKDRVSNVGQLFVLTHNLQFFQQVKNWFNTDKEINSSANFYLLHCTMKNGTRCSKLTPLDDMLQEI